MSDSSATDHTIDGLCRRHKSKVVEMLQQLNELRRRCGALEREVETARSQTQHLIESNSAISQRIDAEEQSLLAAAEASDSAHGRIQQLALELRNRQTETRAARTRLEEDEAQIDVLREVYKQARGRHDRLRIDAAVQFRPMVVDRAQNTDKRRKLADGEAQAPGRHSTSEVAPFDDSVSLVRAAPEVCEVDDDTASLILSLNKY
jgi:chromosome segregation ATPase